MLREGEDAVAGRVAGKVAIVMGGGQTPPETVAAIARAIPGAQFTTIRGAPHMLFIEQPQAVATEILAFLDGVLCVD